jgi:alpha-galactosidase/6-phospho-beta-glucosidase family protein
VTTIAVIGGGSSMFVPGLVRRLLELRCFHDSELRLMDIDEHRLSVMTSLAHELVAAECSHMKVRGTLEQNVALDRVDFAIVHNYTNPASANAMAMASASDVRSLSLCSCSPLPFNKQWLAELAGVPADDPHRPAPHLSRR